MDEDRSPAVPGDVKRITKAKEMRALAHPLRWRLLEVLDLEGQATAAQCARVLGETHSLCSFHLYQLAKYGLVEQVETTSRRDRPWRLTHKDLQFPIEPDDQPGRVAIRSLRRFIASREIELLESWIHQQFDYSEEWRRAAIVSTTRIWLTPAELNEVRDALLDVVVQIEQRKREEVCRDDAARPVRLLLAGFPMEYGTSEPGADAEPVAGPGPGE